MNKLYCVFLLLIFSCGTTKKKAMSLDYPVNKTESKSGYVEFVEIAFTNKVGKVSSGIKELYLRLSVQDYYIKWCESSVDFNEINKLLEKKTDLIKTLNIEYEIKDGLWDACDTNEMVQSRTGKYAIITKLISK